MGIKRLERTMDHYDAAVWRTWPLNVSRRTRNALNFFVELGPQAFL